ncbi:unnamed protein product, partial [Durusdinium trenchii]
LWSLHHLRWARAPHCLAYPWRPMALASDLEEFVRPEEEEEELPDPVERCRTRLRKRRRKVTASLRRALEEDERGRAERQEAHEERLKRLMTERWQRRKRE